jgi:hypothetical protein
MAVFVQVSSINTSRAGSNMPRSRIQRRRARATSARFCSTANKVFFKAKPVSIVEPPHRAAAARNSCSGHCDNDLVQRQVWPLCYQRQQKSRAILQRRNAATTGHCGDASGLFPALRPDHHHAGADPIAFGRLTARRARRNFFDNSRTQIIGIRLRHRYPHSESMLPESLIDTTLGIRPIQPERNML